jgi:hypothetical protein
MSQQSRPENVVAFRPRSSSDPSRPVAIRSQLYGLGFRQAAATSLSVYPCREILRG